MRRLVKQLGLLLITALFVVSNIAAATTLSELTVADVASGSFVVVYRDVEPVNVSLQVFDDVLGTQLSVGVQIDNAYTISGSAVLSDAMRDNALARIRVSGLSHGRAYFYQLTVTPVGGGGPRIIPTAAPLPSLRTTLRSQPQNNALIGSRITTSGGQPTDGVILLVKLAGLPYPLTHVTGDNYSSGFAALALSNLADAAGGENSAVADGAQVQLSGLAGLAGDADAAEVLAVGENIGETWVIPSSPLVLQAFADTDSDGMPDDFERRFGLDPDTDDASDDPDGDGLSNLEEYQNGTDPNIPDTDGDGITDGDEINISGTLPNQVDSDQDGLSDGEEINTTGTDPLDADSDDDGADDGTEIADGTDPNDDTSTPFFDFDSDGIADDVDNCPARSNPLQTNTDFDAFGDECDPDDDNDRIPDELDNAPLVFNPSQTDQDNDGVGDSGDNCNQIFNPDQINSDGDSQGDACDVDDDNDGIFDFSLTGPSSVWAKIIVTVSGVSGTTVPFQPDNNAKFWFYKYDEPNDALIRLGNFNLANREWTPEILSPEELNITGPLVYATGSCDCLAFGPGLSITVETDDGELRIGLPQSTDLPPLIALFVSFDGSSFASRFVGSDPVRLGNHVATGLIAPPLDNCRITPNPDQSDVDGDGKGDVCDNTAEDVDGDDVLNDDDNCPNINNVDQSDIDGDGEGDVCDLDADNDGISNQDELATLGTDPLAADSNGDGINDDLEDFDFDGITNSDELARGLSPDSPDVELRAGLNLVHFPVEVPADYSAFDLLTDLGGDGIVARIERIDPASELVPAAFYDTGVASGDDFDIQPTSAYMITMITARTQSWPGRPLCRSVQFDPGKQLIGFGCVPKGLTSKQLLESLGASSISALQSLDTRTGRFQVAGFDQGVPTGDDYLLTGIEGYLAHLHSGASTELFNLRPPEVLIEGLVDGQTVYDSELPIGGVIGGENTHITINGETITTFTENGETRFGGSIDLVEGLNVITIRVRGADNQLTELTYTINYLRPPDIELLSHFDGQVIPSSQTVLMGTVSNDAASLSLDGVDIAITNGEFKIFAVDLLEGPNHFVFEAIGTNGGIRQLPITITSTPIYMVLTTPSATVPGSGTNKTFSFIDFAVPQSAYDQVSSWGGTGVVFPSFMAIAPGTTFQKLPPNIFRQTYAFQTDEDTSDIGEHDLIYQYRYSTSANATVWIEQVRFRIALVDERNVVLTFDEDYDGLVTTDPVLHLQGRVLGTADSITVNGMDASFGAPASGLANIPFSIDVALQPGENYLDVVASNPNGSDARELLVTFDPNIGLDILIASHPSKSTVSTDDILVSGLVSSMLADVDVNGVTAAVTANPDGSGDFSATIPISPGVNDVRATARIGSQSAGSAVRLTRAAFDLRLDNVVDRGTYRDNRPTLTGSASEDLQSVLVNGVSQSVSGNTFDIALGVSGLTLLAPFQLTPLNIVATSLTGDTAEINISLRYEPFSFVRDDPTETEIDFQLELPETIIPDIVDWRVRSNATFRIPAGLTSSPSEGMIFRKPGFTHLGDGVVTLTAILELHGFGDPFFSAFTNFIVEFLDASGSVIATQAVNTAWTLQPVDTSHLFLVSVHDGYVVDHSPVLVVGQLRNVNATSLTVNGNDVVIADDWKIEIDLVDGENLIEARALDADGTEYIKTATVTLGQPPRLDVTENMSNRGIDLIFFQIDPRSPVYDVFDRGDGYWMNFTDPSSVSTRSVYNRGNSTVQYYNSTARPLISTTTVNDPGDYGIWELTIEIRGFGSGEVGVNPTFVYWINLTDPSLATGPLVAPTSHADGETVTTDTVSYTVEVTNDPFAVVEINGIAVAPTRTRRVVNQFSEVRIDVEYTTDLQLVPGVNNISVRAVSDNGTESTSNFTLNR